MCSEPGPWSPFHCLHRYALVDDRVRQVGLAVKKWANARGVKGAKFGMFSSYTYIILVIHYLQRVEPPVIPSLQSRALIKVGIWAPRPASRDAAAYSRVTSHRRLLQRRASSRWMRSWVAITLTSSTTSTGSRRIWCVVTTVVSSLQVGVDTRVYPAGPHSSCSKHQQYRGSAGRLLPLFHNDVQPPQARCKHHRRQVALETRDVESVRYAGVGTAVLPHFHRRWFPQLEGLAYECRGSVRARARLGFSVVRRRPERCRN